MFAARSRVRVGISLALCVCLRGGLALDRPPQSLNDSPPPIPMLRLREVRRGQRGPRRRCARLPRLMRLTPSEPRADETVSSATDRRSLSDWPGWGASLDGHGGLTERETEGLEAKYEMLQYVHDMVDVKLCGHKCAHTTEWLFTCCQCDGVLPSHRHAGIQGGPLPLP